MVFRLSKNYIFDNKMSSEIETEYTCTLCLKPFVYCLEEPGTFTVCPNCSSSVVRGTNSKDLSARKVVFSIIIIIIVLINRSLTLFVDRRLLLTLTHQIVVMTNLMTAVNSQLIIVIVFVMRGFLFR